LRYVRLPVKGSFRPCAQRARKDWCGRIGRQSPFNRPLGNYHPVHSLIMPPDYLWGCPHQEGCFLL